MDTKNSLIGIGLLGIGGMLLINSIRKSDERARESATLAQTGNNPAVQQAQILRQAMNPYKPLPMGTDGTNSKLILATSKQITDLAAVQKSYAAMYQSELMADLRGELSTKDFNAFVWQIANNAKTATQVSAGGAVTSTAMQAAKQYALGTNYKVWALKDVVLRSAPEASSVQGNVLSQLRFAWEEGNFLTAPKANILELCKASQFVGYTTGKSQIDAQHLVPFIEVWYTVTGKYKGATSKMKARDGQKVRGWVSASPDYTFQTQHFKEAFDKGYKKPVFKA